MVVCVYRFQELSLRFSGPVWTANFEDIPMDTGNSTAPAPSPNSTPLLFLWPCFHLDRGTTTALIVSSRGYAHLFLTLTLKSAEQTQWLRGKRRNTAINRKDSPPTKSKNDCASCEKVKVITVVHFPMMIYDNEGRAGTVLATQSQFQASAPRFCILNLSSFWMNLSLWHLTRAVSPASYTLKWEREREREQLPWPLRWKALELQSRCGSCLFMRIMDYFAFLTLTWSRRCASQRWAPGGTARRRSSVCILHKRASDRQLRDTETHESICLQSGATWRSCKKRTPFLYSICIVHANPRLKNKRQVMMSITLKTVLFMQIKPNKR